MWICSEKVLNLLPPNIKAIYVSKNVAHVENPDGLKNLWNHVLDMSISKKLTEPTFDLSEDLATLSSSSGTTCFPKAVIRTHRNLVTLFHQYP